jgi:DNA-binding response OmpR family regulator
MATERLNRSLLVMEEIEETATLVEMMLNKNGYSVTIARTEEDTIARARSTTPDLILMSSEDEPDAAANRIREHSGISQEVAIVVFCVQTIPQGAEIQVGRNIYLTRPDNFNQLREFLNRLLSNSPAMKLA